MSVCKNVCVEKGFGKIFELSFWLLPLIPFVKEYESSSTLIEVPVWLPPVIIISSVSTAEKLTETGIESNVQFGIDVELVQ